VTGGNSGIGLATAKQFVTLHVPDPGCRAGSALLGSLKLNSSQRTAQRGTPAPVGVQLWGPYDATPEVWGIANVGVRG